MAGQWEPYWRNRNEACEAGKALIRRDRDEIREEHGTSWYTDLVGHWKVFGSHSEGYGKPQEEKWALDQAERAAPWVWLGQRQGTRHRPSKRR